MSTKLRAQLVNFVLRRLLFSLLFLSSHAWAQPNWLPKESNLNIYSRTQDCVLVRALSHRAKETVLETKRILAAQEFSLRRNRSILEACGQQRGLKGELTEEFEFRLASACPDEYDAWLTPSYRFYAVKEEVREAQTYLTKIQGKLGKACLGSNDETAPHIERVAAVISTNPEPK